MFHFFFLQGEKYFFSPTLKGVFESNSLWSFSTLIASTRSRFRCLYQPTISVSSRTLAVTSPSHATREAQHSAYQDTWLTTAPAITHIGTQHPITLQAATRALPVQSSLGPPGSCLLQLQPPNWDVPMQSTLGCAGPC